MYNYQPYGRDYHDEERRLARNAVRAFSIPPSN
jgi:hypothetical protein